MKIKHCILDFGTLKLYFKQIPPFDTYTHVWIIPSRTYHLHDHHGWDVERWNHLTKLTTHSHTHYMLSELRLQSRCLSLSPAPLGQRFELERNGEKSFWTSLGLYMSLYRFHNLWLTGTSGQCHMTVFSVSLAKSWGLREAHAYFCPKPAPATSASYEQLVMFPRICFKTTDQQFPCVCSHWSANIYAFGWHQGFFHQEVNR